jgi:hypothetical protein
MDIKWEYKLIKIDFVYSNDKDVQDKLNIEGSNRWELVTKDGGMFYFKRPKQ